MFTFIIRNERGNDYLWAESHVLVGTSSSVGVFVWKIALVLDDLFLTDVWVLICKAQVGEFLFACQVITQESRSSYVRDVYSRRQQWFEIRLASVKPLNLSTLLCSLNAQLLLWKLTWGARLTPVFCWLRLHLSTCKCFETFWLNNNVCKTSCCWRNTEEGNTSHFILVRLF